MTKDQVEIQNLRTKLNIAKKTLKCIQWNIEHKKDDLFGDGMVSDELLVDIENDVIECLFKLK